MLLQHNKFEFLPLIGTETLLRECLEYTFKRIYEYALAIHKKDVEKTSILPIYNSDIGKALCVEYNLFVSCLSDYAKFKKPDFDRESFYEMMCENGKNGKYDRHKKFIMCAFEFLNSHLVTMNFETYGTWSVYAYYQQYALKLSGDVERYFVVNLVPFKRELLSSFIGESLYVALFDLANTRAVFQEAFRKNEVSKWRARAKRLGYEISSY